MIKVLLIVLGVGTSGSTEVKAPEPFADATHCVREAVIIDLSANSMVACIDVATGYLVYLRERQ